MSTRKGSGVPFATPERENEKPFIERMRSLEVENASLRGQVQVMAVELNMMANWIKQNGGVELFNQEAEVYKNCHPKDEKSVEIEKALAVAVTSVQEPDVLMNPVPPLLIPKMEPGLELFEFDQLIKSEQLRSPSSAPDENNRIMQMEDFSPLEPVPPRETTRIPRKSVNGTDNRRRTLGSKEEVTVPLPTKTKNHFRKPSDLKNHDKIHSKAKPCHMKNHTKDRPHKCSVCARRFVRADYLRRYERLHFGSGTFKFGKCMSLFDVIN